MGDSGPAELISDICHTDVQNPFPVLENGTISPCFNQLILGALPHAGMAFFSVYYLCIPRNRLPQGSTPCSWILRVASALVVTLFFIGDVLVTALLKQDDMYLDILADGCAILAWLVHFGTMIVLRRSILRGTRGPLTLLLLVLLTVPNLMITLIAYYHSEAYLSKEPLKITRLILASGRTFPLTVYILVFIFPCIGDRRETMYNDTVDGTDIIPESSHLDTGEMVAEDGSSCVSRLLYLWLNPLLQRGQRGELDTASDIYHLPQKLRTAVIQRHFYHCWEASQKDAAARSRKQDQWPSRVDRNGGEELGLDSEVVLVRVLHKAFGLRYYVLGLLKLVGNILGFAGPLLLSNLVSFVEDEGAPVSRGAWCALGLFASTLLSAVLQNIFTFQVSKVALSARAALVSAMYEKALRVSSSGLARFTLGELVNFISIDTDHVVSFFNSFHELWSLPFQFSITLYLLYLQMGVAFLGGLGVALLLIPLNKILASRILDNNKQMLRYKDSRVKLMAEVLFGIRIIKLYNWETLFTQKIEDCRKQELSHLKAIKYLDAVCVYTWAALPVVITILTIVTYVLLGHQMTAAKVFTTLALVGMLILPLNNFPWVINSILEAKVSLERIQQFLRLSNQDLYAYYTLVCPEDPQISVLLNQGSFSWQDSDGTDNTEQHLEMETCITKGSLPLRILNLNITKGSLVVVVGKVGCGKSSLLAAITGELNRLGGTVYVEERKNGFGLASQEPWIQHATVQDNILFGKHYNPTFYQTVIDACALTDDLNILPKGDKTEVGENGVTLSGGQKARLALARAVYMEKDIYLLDDPLAAVDNDVAHHLMQKCIMGILRNKTRILCTHRIEFVDKADMVVLMDNGTIIKTGTPAEVLPMVGAVPTNRRNDTNDEEKEQVEDLGVSNELQAEEESDLSGEEQKQVGGLEWKVYRSYWVAVGRVLSLSILMSLLLMQASKNVSDWWLSNWISELKNNGPSWINGSSTVTYSSPHLLLSPGGLQVSPLPFMKSSHVAKMSSEIFYLTVYSSIAIANTLFTAVRAFLFAYGAICAATVIHNRLLDTVLKATMTFFDTNPLGRVLNRFSSDLYTIDDSLPFVLNILLANIFGLLGMLVVMTYSLPWILVALLPLGLLYHCTQNFYRQTSRELKRLYSLTLSPIYSHFSETLSGLGTIRASRSSARFEQENLRCLEQNQRCLFLSNAAMQWLDIRLQMIGVAVVTGISMIAVIQHDSIDPGLVGLSLSYALSITGLLSGLIFSYTQTEMQLVSVERIEEYCSSLPTEPQHQNPQVPPSWPQKGRLEFCGVVLAYRETLPNALDGLSLVVHPGEKVGIVGRTGSGKSTLFLALFRMVELNQGQILLDHLDISTVGLAQLRSKLAIIPQDPFLFSGSVRENLDPRGQYTDQSLLDALDQCHLSHVVDRMGGLDAEVGEKGKTFSLGQRQLLCLARALLTQANVLCIDEATASVDHKTDKLLQQTIRQRFQNKTVLTIAHRIDTIMDSDRVLVMHAGKVVEFDTPSALYQIDNSVFHRLVDGGDHGKT